MTRRPRRNHSPAFKAKVELTALKGDRTMSELATQFDLHPTAFIAGRADARSGISHPATANPGRGITELEIYLGNGLKMFKRTEPPLTPLANIRRLGSKC